MGIAHVKTFKLYREWEVENVQMEFLEPSKVEVDTVYKFTYSTFV